MFRAFGLNVHWGSRLGAYNQAMTDKHDPLELEWFKIGLAGPARRALVGAKLYKVSDLRKISLTELQSLHGMGKSAIARIREIMDAKKIKFRSE